MKWSEQPQYIKLAMARKVMRTLRFDYPGLTTEMVLEELDSENRTPLGIEAAYQLAQAGFEDME